jgi:tRNA pseudouridine38-40 synthase
LLEGRNVTVHGSGRTDAGVHAEGQVASVQLQRGLSPDRLRAALNGNLPRDVRIFSVEVAPEEFHARFSAQGKTYLYRVVLCPVMSPFWERYAHQEARQLDIERMQRAAKMFYGTHDWTAFANAHTDTKTRVRTITELSLKVREDLRAGAPMLEISASADGFLRYMVRSLVGTLLAVGRDEMDETAVRRAIEHGDRSLAGATAPARGLTLLRVHYG